MAAKPANIDAYIKSFPEDVAAVLTEIRRTITGVLPDATEAIAYDIPTFQRNGHNVVHFAGWKKHVSLYPIPDGDAAFELEIAPYRAGKGTVKFPLGEPIPYDLVARIAAMLAER
ncbi:iron chaperone [Nocardia sp. NPDC057440]|uniref:iron chaperone n=1 Tax=Nocardia sp. NPDC057440 TaxID=3346134 RepID=UPI00366CDE42